MGFVAHLHGARSNEVLRHALTMLTNLEHRGAVGGDADTSDGAGVLLQLPHAFLKREATTAGIAIPDAGRYGVGMCFLPRSATRTRAAAQEIDQIIRAHGCRTLGWRDVPIDPAVIGSQARTTLPRIRQFFVAPAGFDGDATDGSVFERQLYVVRRDIERQFQTRADGSDAVYVASLSARTIVYKGLVRPSLIARFFRDLASPEIATAVALVHSRFSTNTFPAWARAHPYRMLCHNGEINTLGGNLRWTAVREEQMSSPRFPDVHELFPLIAPGQSDSASLDNALELLVQGGRSLPHAMLMLIPQAWEGDDTLAPERRAFFDYHASLMQPWDGPAAIAVTDGRHIGAMLDRNGLRPARYLVTNDDLVVLASEAGALPVPIDNIRAKGRVRPGTMLLVNTTQGRIVEDEEIKNELAALHPYQRWLTEQQIPLPACATPDESTASPTDLARRQQAFGYSREDLRMLLAPMAATGEEPVGSMGNDTPLAVLSDRPQLLYAYFRQLFAQVTNPAIDPIRERLVMSLAVRIGALPNLLDPTPAVRHLRLEHPVLDSAAFDAVTATELRTAFLDGIFRAGAGSDALERAVEAICASAAAAVRAGAELLVLSDAGADAGWAPIPALLAVSAVHHHLIRERLRSRASIVVRTNEARDVSQIALLISYGASAVYPELALKTVADLVARGERPEITDASQAQAAYVNAVKKGLLKIMSKMGISTMASYHGAQTFEAVGLSAATVQRYFNGTASRLGGIGLREIAEETLSRHHRAWQSRVPTSRLDDAGMLHYRLDGERHLWNPGTIATLQWAARSGRYDTFKEFTRAADMDSRDSTLRGLLDFADVTAVPLSEVEPASSIVRRFVAGAMSFGSLSREAHETLAVAMNRIGGRSNTGEGGEDRARFGTERNSAIKQVASGRFGVTTEYLVNAAELQIKIAQGAKPGEGGQLPGHKVDAVIARTRHSMPGVTLISPPPHHDIYSIEDLAQLIHDLRSVNPVATISVKLVAEAGVGTIAVGVAKARADLITISGDSGGTGASPLSSIRHAGVPWELGLAETQQALRLNALRRGVRLQTDGQMKTGRDVVVAALLGAEEFGFATAPLIVEGCVMMRKCHLNTCPVGIATQDPVLREKFSGRPEHLVNYFFFVAEEVREILARLGVRALGDLIGRADLLRPRRVENGKRASLDLTPLLYVPEPAFVARTRRGKRRQTAPARDVLPGPVDAQLIAQARHALESGEPVAASLAIDNTQRSVGAMLSGDVARRYGHDGLPDDTIVFSFAGSAGQSFGAFLAHGVTLELDGEANDYVGKGLSGGRLIVRPPRGATFIPDDTVIIGNTALYGATAGEAFFRGVGGERFAVRNSGATAVVEGVGDHGCEYMTGGIVVVLGRTGRNFAAGMSGGVAYVLDLAGDLTTRCNRTLAHLSPVAEVSDVATLRQLVERHARYTGSARARHVLAHWDDSLRHFVRVIPTEYLAALTATSAPAADQKVGDAGSARA